MKTCQRRKKMNSLCSPHLAIFFYYYFFYQQNFSTFNGNTQRSAFADVDSGFSLLLFVTTASHLCGLWMWFP